MNQGESSPDVASPPAEQCQRSQHRVESELEALRAKHADLQKSYTALRSEFDLQREKLERAAEEAAQLGRILEQSLNEVYLFDADTLRFLKVNRGARQNLGYTMDQLRDLTPLDLKPTFTAEAFAELIEPLRLGSEKHIIFETGHRRMDGSEYDVEVHLQMARFQGRACFVAIILDITDRKAAEEALRERERAHVTLINHLPGAAFRSGNDREWSMQFVSDGIALITGYSARQFLEGVVHLGNLIHPDDQESVWKGVQEAVKKRESYQVVYRLVCRENSTKTLWEQGEGVFSPDGELLALEGFITDITELKEAEEALRNLYDFNENLIATAQNIVLVIDPDGRVVRFNPAFERLSGWSLDEAEGSDWFETFLPKRYRAQSRRLFDEAIAGELGQWDLIPIVTKDGAERKMDWRAALLKDSSENLVGLLCTGSDVTDRLRLEQEVINASEEERRRIAQDLHDDLGSLLTGIDFRMKALTNLMSKRGHETEADSSSEINELVREAIRKTRTISKGLHAVGSHPDDLKVALNELVERVRSESDMRCQFRCPKPVLIGDAIMANHLFRIAQEAVNNAVKYSGGTQITVSLSDSDTHIALSVLDNGTGFERLDQEPRGLGLHTMNYRATAIGGFLRISRGKEGGTMVACNIPSCATDASTEDSCWTI